jgi:zinc transporter ZupT
MSEETKPETKTKPHGTRKVRHSREAILMLFCGFLVAAWLKVSIEIFSAFVLGLGTLSGAFMYGNVQEHKAQASAQ